MYNGHFRQHIGHNQSDACSKNVGKNDGRPSEADAYAASQEQADTDGAANGHHCELPLAQAAVQTLGLRHGRFFSGKRR
jgi:hypothetical protein